MYKKASKLKIRFNTSKGLLSVEQMWDLSMTAVANVVKSLKKELNVESDDDLSFLDENAPQVDTVLQLKFDIAKDIYLSKRAERDEQVASVNKKAELQKLLAIKAKRADEATEKMSDADLDAKIAELSK